MAIKGMIFTEKESLFFEFFALTEITIIIVKITKIISISKPILYYAISKKIFPTISVVIIRTIDAIIKVSNIYP